MESQHAIAKSKIIPKIILPRFLFVGHPRCGSGYVSKVLNCYGLQIGHEIMRKHGIVSWFATNYYDDTKISCRKYTGYVRTHNDDFKKIVHYVRDPYTAIPSIMNENKYIDSYIYRRDVIKHYYKIDLDSYNEPDKSVVSFLYWNDLASTQTNLFIRVENCIDDINNFLSEFGYSTKTIEEYPLKNYHHREREKVNYNNISTKLVEKLELFCIKYGYESFIDRLVEEIDIKLINEDFD